MLRSPTIPERPMSRLKTWAASASARHVARCVLLFDVAHRSRRSVDAFHTNVDRSARRVRQSYGQRCLVGAVGSWPRRVLPGHAFECLERAVLSARHLATDVRFDSSEHPG
jgi:hypothetical protein